MNTLDTQQNAKHNDTKMQHVIQRFNITRSSAVVEKLCNAPYRKLPNCHYANVHTIFICHISSNRNQDQDSRLQDQDSSLQD